MKALILSLTLSTFLSLSRAMALNNTSVASRHLSRCEAERERAEFLVAEYHIVGVFIPRCDPNGNFLPQQSSGSTGYCWCVNVITGEKIPNTETAPGTTPVDCYHDTYCPYGWSRFGKQCFIFINSSKTWIEAEAYCLFELANLASVHSYEENVFIQALTRASTHDFPHTWIGGYDVIYFSFWMWSDGSKFNYENWSQFKDDKGHCLMMNYGKDLKWNCLACNTTLPFVCAKTI